MVYRADSISKSYGATKALEDVSLEFTAGEIHALLGMNGAGKSTLVTILSGIEQPDQGRLLLDGEEVTPSSRVDARRLGIALVPQHSTLFPHLDLATNMFAGDELTAGPIIRVRDQRNRAREELDRVNLALPVTMPAASLSVGEAQLVEIARALQERPRVLFLDEPTAALPRGDRDRLFRLLRSIASEGTAIILVTHFLDEALDHADRISVLRDRRVVLSEAPRAELTLQGVIAHMAGPERQFAAVPATRVATADGSLESHLGRGIELSSVSGSVLTDVTLTAGPGEIVGVAGLLGSGVDELIDIVIGSVSPRAGTIRYPDGSRPRSVRAAVQSGLAYIPSDRAGRALMGRASLFANAALVRLGALTAPAARPLRLGRERREAEAALNALQTKYDDPAQPASTLSGGNQQKVVFAKWILAGSRVFVLDDPTRAVDIHAKAEMHAVIQRLRGEGKVIIFASTDIEELERMCDRVLVFAHGRLVNELGHGNDLSVESIMEAMSA